MTVAEKFKSLFAEAIVTEDDDLKTHLDKQPIQAINFEADDFTGAVILTVNQAKELATKLKNNAEFFFLQTGEFDYDTDELWQCLTDKIDQAEKGDA